MPCGSSTQVPSEVHAAGVRSEKVQYIMHTENQYVAKHRELTAQFSHTPDKDTLSPWFRGGMDKAVS